MKKLSAGTLPMFARPSTSADIRIDMPPAPAPASTPRSFEDPALLGVKPSDLYYGWLMVLMAALAMLGTLPGRTHGLGLITERLLADRSFVVGPQVHGLIEWWGRLVGGTIDADGEKRILYGLMNFWGTLLGALFCLGFGTLIDRLGCRRVTTVVVLALGAVVLWMTQVRGMALMFLAILLTRGLGQSALSVVSITLVGKWFQRGLGPAMGLYSFLVGFLFALSFGVARGYKDADWRLVWGAMGTILLCILGPMFWLLIRDNPEQMGATIDGKPLEGATSGVDGETSASEDFALWEALATPAFWTFALAAGLYGLMSSGISLFSESILKERGFSNAAMYNLQIGTTGIGLLANLSFGWLARKWRLGGVMAVAMALMTAALFELKYVNSVPMVVLYALKMGIAGGGVTVVFFMVWGKLFGRKHLGEIQGVAQMLTVFSSAIGPLMLAVCKAQTGTYTLVFETFAPLAGLMGLAAALVPTPRRRTRLPIEES
jgi:MFS family permease